MTRYTLMMWPLLAACCPTTTAGPRAPAGPRSVSTGRPATQASELVRSCRQDDHARVKALLAAGGDPDARDRAGAPLLLVAAGRGHHKTAAALLAAGADLHVVDSAMGVSAMHRAAQSGQVKILQLLLSGGAYLDQQSAVNGHTPLLDACFYKRYAAVEFLLKQGANTALRNTLGLTPMDWARRQKDARLLTLLKQQHERDRQREQRQRLLAATRAGDHTLAAQLLAAGSVPDQVAKDGNTPLLLAAKLGHTEIVKALLEKGADPNRTDRLMKATPGHKAGFFGHAAIMLLLIKHGLKLDARGPYNGYTALHDAILNAHIETAKVLMEAGASTSIKGIDGKSPKDLAREKGLTGLLKLMKR